MHQNISTIRFFLTFLVAFLALGLKAQTDTLPTPSVNTRGGARPLNTPFSRPDTLAPAVDTLRIDSLGLVSDTLRPDSLMPKKVGPIRGFFTKNYPNPRKAALMSLVIPGAGQAYNKKYWKIPLVYAVLAGLTYVEINNIDVYQRYKTSYRALVDEDTTTVPHPDLIRQDRVTMRANRDIARKNLERSSLFLGLGYLLSVTDAYVDAHMATFDVSDDLSLKFCPKMQASPATGAYFGVGVVLAFK